MLSPQPPLMCHVSASHPGGALDPDKLHCHAPTTCATTVHTFGLDLFKDLKRSNEFSATNSFASKTPVANTNLKWLDSLHNKTKQIPPSNEIVLMVKKVFPAPAGMNLTR